MKLLLFPGCALKTTARGFETSALASASALGIELIELPRWNCCGTVHSLLTDDVVRHIAPIRNLLRVQELDRKPLLGKRGLLVTLCSMCFNTLKRSALLIKEDIEKLRKINSFMEREREPYQGFVKVVNFLEVLRDDVGYERISETVKKPLRGMRVAPYYGCMLLRPKGIGIDDPENPQILENVLRSLGADIVDSPFKTKCCGSYHTVERRWLAVRLSHKILSNFTSNGAEAVATACPLCAFNLDSRQREMKQLHPEFKEIPVFYYTQLMALSFGLDGRSVGLDSNEANPHPVLRKRGLWNRSLLPVGV